MSALMKRRIEPPRRGFTLVELLVVMGIIALLASIGVYAFQPFQGRSAVNNGGILLQSWLTAAKQRALRDQQPRGLRLLPGDEIVDDSSNPITTLVTKCIFIEQQEDITGTVLIANGLSLTTTAPLPVTLTQSDYSYIEINGGPLRFITSTVNSGNKAVVNLQSQVFVPLNSGATFRIYRTPKAVSGGVDTTGSSTEEILRIPAGAAINVGANAQFSGSFGYTLNPAVPPLDIMFSPNGSVMFPNLNYDKIALWVTGTQRNAAGVIDPKQGQPNLVVINSRTGLIGGYNAKLDWDTTTAPPKWKNTSPYLLVP